VKQGSATLKLVFFIAIATVAAIIFLVGIPFSKIAGVYDIEPAQKQINYGLDLTGGVYVVLQADESEGTEVTDETLDKAIATIRNRIDSMGLKEPTISKQGSNQIRVSIPGTDNQQEALDTIGKTAQLTFVDPDGNVLLTGADVENATYQQTTDSTTGLIDQQVSLEFNADGTQKFADATEQFYGQQITIKLDDEVISAPTVQAVISDGKASITNIGSKDDAISLARLIRAGALPVSFTPVQVETIGPTLGADSLHRSLVAGAVGIALILVFMIIFYRLPGLAADLAIIAYLLIFLNFLAIAKVTLTLPGIAGIILSVGMAVDANVIIFERIKEELRLGKTIANAITNGFSKALTSIIDSNITTIIAGAALFFFGSGTIRGFALTLMIGVAISLFTAVTLTRALINWLSVSLNLKSPSLYGVKGVIAE